MTGEEFLYKRLNELNISYVTIEHEPFFTVEQARAFREKSDAGHAKNLFLKDDSKQLWLIVACADTTIQLKKLSKELNAKNLRFAQPELLKKHLGVVPGSVSPFALINDSSHRVRVIVDKKLHVYSTVGFHPLRNNATTVIKPMDLMHFLTDCGNKLQCYDFE